MFLVKQWWFAGTIVWLTIMASSAALLITSQGFQLPGAILFNAALLFSGFFLVAVSMVVRVRENQKSERIESGASNDVA